VGGAGHGARGVPRARPSASGLPVSGRAVRGGHCRGHRDADTRGALAGVAERETREIGSKRIVSLPAISRRASRLVTPSA
jgi:hypothetical protein